MAWDVLSKSPGFGEKFAQSLGQGLSKGFSQGQDFSQQMSLQKQKYDLASQMKKKENETEKFSLALGTLQEMRNKLKSGNVGTKFGIQLNPFANIGESGRDREEFAQYGRSLIPLVAAGVPVKNKIEFEEYSKVITNPNASMGQLEGALNGLENIFARKVEGILGNEEESEKKEEGFSIVKAPNGKKVRVPKNKLKEALSKGGELIE